MNKDLIIGVIVLIVIVVLGLWWASKVPVPTTEQPVGGESSVTTLPEGDVYAVNTASSTFKWSGSFVSGLKSHTGTVKISSGEFIVDQGALVGGRFTLDLKEITESKNEAKLITHLQSADFFDVAIYPTANFVITKLEAGDPATAEAVVTGDLTIKGITKPITFPAIISMSGETITARAKFSFDRSMWEIKYGSDSFFKDLGDKVIADEVPVEVTIVAVKS